jgi:hypothetical protein
MVLAVSSESCCFIFDLRIQLKLALHQYQLIFSLSEHLTALVIAEVLGCFYILFSPQ